MSYKHGRGSAETFIDPSIGRIDSATSSFLLILPILLIIFFLQYVEAHLSIYIYR